MGSGLVYVPAGVYKVHGTILLNRDKVVIQGETSTPAMTITTGGCRPSISTTFVACPSCDKSGRLIAVRLRRPLPRRLKNTWSSGACDTSRRTDVEATPRVAFLASANLHRSPHPRWMRGRLCSLKLAVRGKNRLLPSASGQNDMSHQLVCHDGRREEVAIRCLFRCRRPM